MLLQQRYNLPPAFLATFFSAFLTTLLSALFTTSGFCLSVFSRSPTFNRFSGGEEHGNTFIQQRGGGRQELRRPPASSRMRL